MTKAIVDNTAGKDMVDVLDNIGSILFESYEKYLGQETMQITTKDMNLVLDALILVCNCLETGNFTVTEKE